jgi:hypothetical protein
MGIEQIRLNPSKAQCVRLRFCGKMLFHFLPQRSGQVSSTSSIETQEISSSAKIDFNTSPRHTDIGDHNLKHCFCTPQQTGITVRHRYHFVPGIPE